MRIRQSSWVFLVAGLCATGSAQVPSTTPTNGTATAAVPQGSGAATADFAGAIGPVRQAIADVRLDRWKLPKGLREDTDGDLGSIKRDLDETLPGLLTTADATPSSVTAQLPVASNVGALYDVLLRVTERAKVGAPAGQLDELIQAQTGLENARRSFADRIQHAAAAEEAQVSSLQKAASAHPAVAVVCPPVTTTPSSATTTAKKKKKKVVPQSPDAGTGTTPAPKS